MNTTPAIGWMLRAPSTSGGKIYAILVADRAVLFGWGREDTGLPGMQYKFKTYATNFAAQEAALEKTRDKETRQYEMAIYPKAHTFPMSYNDIRNRVAGDAVTRRALFSAVFLDGALLSQSI